MSDHLNTGTDRPPRARLIWGGAVFIAGFLAPLLIPFVIASSLPASFKTLISGLLAIGIPELFMLMAAAILGKPGFRYLKSGIYSWFKKYGPPGTVSRTRYRIGLIMFIIPILMGFVLPYVWEMIPFLKDNLLYFIITGDLVLLISLFVLGGDFWDKLRSLFIYKSRAVMVAESSQKSFADDQEITAFKEGNHRITKRKGSQAAHQAGSGH